MGSSSAEEHAFDDSEAEQEDSGVDSVDDGDDSDFLLQRFWRRLNRVFPVFHIGDAGSDEEVLSRPVLESSDLWQKDRRFTIVTTAALPWRTGTAVNPTLRAAYLARMERDVTLMLPWLTDLSQQALLFPDGLTFRTQEEQEHHVRRWLAEEAGFGWESVAKLKLRIAWYPARYAPEIGSIIPHSPGWTRETFPKECGFDVLILEEPEHLNWYYHGERWPALFDHVVGIVHTNYLDYAMEKEGRIGHWLSKTVSTLVCLSYVDVNVKLSNVLMKFPNEVVCNCHGVREAFLEIGDASNASATRLEAVDTSSPLPAVGRKSYFLGKALWTKGYGNLLEMMKPPEPIARGWFFQVRRRMRGSSHESLPFIDCYMSGPDAVEVREEAMKHRLAAQRNIKEDGYIDTDEDNRTWPLRFFAGIDHADERLRHYTVFVNPSTSDVLCTATAEALAMGKRVVITKHPSNDFFEANFPGLVLTFKPGDSQEFFRAIKKAEAMGPTKPLSQEQRRLLTWEAANERLFDASAVRVMRAGVLRRRGGDAESRDLRPSDITRAKLGYIIHYGISSGALGELLRTLTGAGPESPWAERKFIKKFLEAWERARDWDEWTHMKERWLHAVRPKVVWAKMQRPTPLSTGLER